MKPKPDSKPKRKLSDFRQQAQNLNKHTERGMGMLDESMKEVGYSAPMVAAADGYILDGSARHETAANVFGSDAEPIIVESDGKRPIVVVRTDIKDAKSKAAKRLAAYANRVGQVNLEWDVPNFEALLAEDAEAMKGLFGGDELSEILRKLEPDTSDAEPQMDRAAELNKKWKVKTGDFWRIGDHELICGDSALIPWIGSTLIFDPEWDSATPTPRQFDSTLVFTDGRRIADAIKQFGPPCWAFVWDCSSCWFTPNRPLQRIKLCLWYGNIDLFDADGAHYGDAGDIRQVTNTRGSYKFKPDPRGKHLADLFQEPITKTHADGIHNHSKPVDWIRLLIGDCTTGDVSDPFIGSGTTMVACEQLGRKCQGIEISPDYCAVILQRMQDAFPKLKIERSK